MISSLVTLVLIGGGIATAQEAPPVVNGDRTSDYEAVGVLLACGGSYCSSYCSGTLVDEKWVVTAAHCVEAGIEYDDYGYATYFGLGPNVNNLDDYAEAADLIPHPRYNASSLQHDIGLIELKTALTSVEPMPVNKDTVKSTWKGEELAYVGYGITGDSEDDSGVKRFAEMPIYDYDDQFIYSLDTEDSQNLCSGDSGGAALELQDAEEAFELAGVNSFVFAYEYSNRSCEGGGAGVTRVDTNLDFIEDYVEVFSYEEMNGGGDEGGGEVGGDDGGGDEGGDDGGGDEGAGEGGTGGGGVGFGVGDGSGSRDDDDEDGGSIGGLGSCAVVQAPAGAMLALVALGAVLRRRED